MLKSKFSRIEINESSRIETLVVVANRAVIEGQTYMRLVMPKDIVAKDLGSRKVFRQKQCLPAYRHQVILFESASCKNSETSCLESRGELNGGKQSIDIQQLHKCIVKIHVYCTSKAASQCDRYNQAIQYTGTTLEPQQRISLLNYLFMCIHTLPGIVDGARKTS